ncbi:Uncharacterised protein [Burkholderia pseudomallei]|nr:Uncharacterised protein [Burkholderia pseudomallei]
MRDEDDVLCKQSQSFTWNLGAKKDGGGFLPVAREKMALQSGVKLLCKRERGCGHHSPNSRTRLYSTSAK